MKTKFITYTFIVAILVALMSEYAAKETDTLLSVKAHTDKFGRPVIVSSAFTIEQKCYAGRILIVFIWLESSANATVLRDLATNNFVPCDDKAEIMIERRRLQSIDKEKI